MSTPKFIKFANGVRANVAQIVTYTACRDTSGSYVEARTEGFHVTETPEQIDALLGVTADNAAHRLGWAITSVLFDAGGDLLDREELRRLCDERRDPSDRVGFYLCTLANAFDDAMTATNNKFAHKARGDQ
jgi:hypothetical protein